MFEDGAYLGTVGQNLFTSKCDRINFLPNNVYHSATKYQIFLINSIICKALTELKTCSTALKYYLHSLCMSMSKLKPTEPEYKIIQQKCGSKFFYIKLDFLLNFCVLKSRDRATHDEVSNA